MRTNLLNSIKRIYVTEKGKKSILLDYPLNMNVILAEFMGWGSDVWGGLMWGNDNTFWGDRNEDDRKTASGEILKRERGWTERKRVSSSAFLPEAEHTLFSFIMSWAVCSESELALVSVMATSPRHKENNFQTLFMYMTGDSYKRYINYQKIKPSRRTAQAAGTTTLLAFAVHLVALWP